MFGLMSKVKGIIKGKSVDTEKKNPKDGVNKVDKDKLKIYKIEDDDEVKVIDEDNSEDMMKADMIEAEGIIKEYKRKREDNYKFNF